MPGCLCEVQSAMREWGGGHPARAHPPNTVMLPHPPLPVHTLHT